MEIISEQYKQIEGYFPTQRGNVKNENLQVLNAILYVSENGCKWRALPKRFGNWHTIYMRMNRWAKNGILDRVFEALQRENTIQIRVEAVSLDSTIVKVHPDGTEAQKKRSTSHWQIQRRMDYQNSYGCRGCSSSSEFLAFAGQCP